MKKNIFIIIMLLTLFVLNANEKANNNLNKKQHDFYNKYFTKEWNLDPFKDKNKIYEKYQSYLAGGIFLVVLGELCSFSSGFFYGFGMSYSKEVTLSGTEIYGGIRVIAYPFLIQGIAGGSIFLLVGSIFSALSVIPFWFAYMISVIYKKITNQKLKAFIEKTSLDLKFDKNKNEFEIGLIIKI